MTWIRIRWNVDPKPGSALASKRIRTCIPTAHAKHRLALCTTLWKPFCSWSMMTTVRCWPWGPAGRWRWREGPDPAALQHTFRTHGRYRSQLLEQRQINILTKSGGRKRNLLIKSWNNSLSLQLKKFCLKSVLIMFKSIFKWRNKCYLFRIPHLHEKVGFIVCLKNIFLL